MTKQVAVHIHFFAGIAESAGTTEDVYQCAESSTIADVCNALVTRYGSEFAQQLRACAFLVNGCRLSLKDQLPNQDSINLDVLPPFAGG